MKACAIRKCKSGRTARTRWRGSTLIPAAAIPLLIECTADANDGLRMNAARALKLAPAASIVEVMQHLVADPNSRVRLIAASSLLAAEPGNALAVGILVESLNDPVRAVQEAARALLDSRIDLGQIPETITDEEPQGLERSTTNQPLALSSCAGGL